MAANRGLYLSVSANTDPLTASLKAGKSVLAQFGTAANATAEEVEKAFRELGGANLEATAKSIERSYAQTFRTVRQNAQAMLNAPTQGGAVEIINAAQAEQSARAAERLATELRQAAAAAAVVAQRAGEAGAAERTFAVALAANAQAAEQDATALRQQANVLAEVNRELVGVGVAQKRVTQVNGQARAGYQQLSYQIGDVSTQYASGTALSLIFAQQAGQVTQAISMITGEAKGFLGVLAGPWGIVISSALVLLAPFVGKLLEGDDALKKETDSLKKNAENAAIADRAKELFARTEAGAIDDVRKLTDELKKQNDALKTNGELQNIRAKKDLDTLRKERTKAAEAAAKAEKDLAAMPRGANRSGIESSAYTRAQEGVQALRRALAAKDREIAEAGAILVETRKGLVEEEARRGLDKLAQIKDKYEGDDGLIALARKHATAEETVNGVLRRRLNVLLKAQQAEEAAEQKRRSSAKAEDKAGPLTSFRSPVGAAPVTGQFGEKRSDHTHQGVDYAVPVGTAVRAPAAGTIDVAGPKSGYGNAIYINFGGGTTGRYGHLSKFNVKPGDRVEAGDIIGFSGGAPGAPGSGRSTGAHLHEEIRVNGRAVDPRKRRFRTDAGAAADDADKIREREEQRAEQEKVQAAERERAAEAQLRGALDRRARAILTSTDTLEERARLEIDALRAESEQRLKEIDAQQAAGKLTQAEADRLRGIEVDTAFLEEIATKRREQSAIMDRQLAADRAELDRKTSMLQLHADLARTDRARREIALRLLAAEEARLKREAQRVLDDPNATPDERKAAQGQIDQVDAESPFRKEAVRRQTADPVEQYRERLRKSAGDLNDALKNVQADGLQELEDGLVGVITGTETVAGAFKKMALSILADLARIAIQRAILGAIGGGEGEVAGSSPGSSPSYGGGILKLFGFADGGRVSGPGTGTSDSILARVSNGEFVMNASATARHLPMLQAMNDNSLPAFATGGLVGSDQIYLRRVPAMGEIRQAGSITAPVSISIDARGADAAGLARLEAQIAQLRSDLPGTIVGTVSDARQRGMLG